jgi:signal peptidase I
MHFEPLRPVPKSAIQAASRFAVGVGLVALVGHTWFLMGLVAPVTVAGSSMAPTLSGPRRTFRCEACQQVFAVGLDQLPLDEVDACPACGAWSRADDSRPVRGDRLLVDRTAYLFRGPRRWEIVVFRSPHDAGQLCVKRVAGLPGETVSSAEGKIWIGGRAIESPLGAEYEARPGDHLNTRPEWQLGPTEYFVLGDNAAISDDSRSWPSGPGVDAKRLVGRPLGVR